MHSVHSICSNSPLLTMPHATPGADNASSRALHAVQESQDAAVHNPGSAYAASPLSPVSGGAAGNTPGISDIEAGTRPEPMPSPLQGDEDSPQHLDGEAEGSEADSEQHGLALPFEPVALVFKDIHYYVKQLGSDLELLRVCAGNTRVCVCASVSVCLCVCAFVRLCF